LGSVALEALSLSEPIDAAAGDDHLGATPCR